MTPIRSRKVRTILRYREEIARLQERLDKLDAKARPLRHKIAIRQVRADEVLRSLTGGQLGELQQHQVERKAPP